MAETDPTPALLEAAARAAAGGHLGAAERLLETLPAEERTPEAWLLAGRIAAQKGNLDRAIDAFRKALLAEPGHREARAALDRARKLAGRPLPRLWLRVRALGAGALVVALLLGGIFITTRWGPSSLPSEAEADLAGPMLPSSPEPSRAPGPQEPLKPEGSQASEPPPTPAVPSDLRLPGLELRPEPGALAVLFVDGLFPSGGVEPTPAGAELLGRLAAGLADHPELRPITIDGHTDRRTVRPGAPYRDNGDLALARALSVARHLRAAADLPPEDLLLRAPGTEATPSPPADPATEARNRTAVLHLAAPVQQPWPPLERP